MFSENQACSYSDSMERNKYLLWLILIFTFFSTIIGIYSLKPNPLGQSNKFSKGKVFGDSIFLLKIEGEIHSGKSTYSSTGADTVLAKLRDIEDKQEIKGIIIEINSPGGTVGASQEIFEELLLLRKSKKIVVSMKDLAASGGYYIASAADFIYAQPGTITGSIGVIAMSPNISGLMEKYNVKMNIYKQGKYKDILSMFKDPSSEERQIIQSMLESTYKRFISDIARGRNMSNEKVEKFAEGRIFSGEDALKKKVVDGIGGRRDAQGKISELLGIEATLPIQEEEESPFDRFFNVLNNKIVMHFSKDIKSVLLEEIYRNPVLLILPTSMRF
jgi:protease IV